MKQYTLFAVIDLFISNVCDKFHATTAANCFLGSAGILLVFAVICYEPY